VVTIALTLEQKRALRNKGKKRGKPPTTLPALQALKPGEDVDFPLGPGKSYKDEQSANSARSSIEAAARKAGIAGEAFDWTEPAEPGKDGKPGKPARYLVTFARA